MKDILDALFRTPGLEPIGATLGWRPLLVTANTLTLAVTCLAYLTISAAAWMVLRRRQDLPPGARGLALLLIGLLMSAALMHAAELLALWVPAHGLVALLRLATAATAGATAVLLWPRIPDLIALPSPRDLARANLALVQANASLETAVAWRTHEIELATQRFEQALSRSNITVFTQDTDFRYTWIYNPRLGLSAEQMVGRTTEELLPGAATDEALALKRQALDRGQTANATVAVPTGSEGRLYLDMTVSPTYDRAGAIDGLLCTAVDVTEKRLFEVRLTSLATQLGAAYRRLELALENSGITVFEQDRELRYTFMHNPPPGVGAEEILGRTDAEIFPEADWRKFVPAKERVLASGGRETVEFELEVGGTQRFFDLRLEAETDGDGRILGVIGTALDLTERRADEKRIRLMMRELTHRSKNLLAVIQAMARKTASLSDDTESFIAGFSARLRAMAAAHDLLVSQSWHGADLGELIRASVAQTISPSAEQVQMHGPPMMLPPDTAQNLGLAFHELATNASKYGALAADAGRLEVSWEEVGGEVRIRWREAGGPPVTPPERHGFGRVLLERLVGATLNGSVTLDFRREGLVCDIVFPRDRPNAP